MYGNVLFGPKVSIGDNSYVHGISQLSNVSIGKYCCIAKNFMIVTSNHNYKNFTNFSFWDYKFSPLIDYKKINCNSDLIELKDIIIENDVWIGHGVTIVGGGIRIGIGAVIGSGSIVTKDVPAYAIAAGIPARVLKYRFSEKVREQLIHSEWWNLSADQLYECYHYLCELSADEIS